MTSEFDYQWENLKSKNIEYSKDRIKEFLKFTKFKKNLFSKKISEIQNKICLDVGCGNGRYTYAMLQLGAERVNSIDKSEEAIKKCKKINSNAKVGSIFDLSSYSKCNFVLCWGVLNHIEKPRDGFNRIASQVQKNGILHIMVYHKDTQKQYEQERGIWDTLPLEEKIDLCKNKVKNQWGRYSRLV